MWPGNGYILLLEVEMSDFRLNEMIDDIGMIFKNQLSVTAAVRLISR
jgi:hypothetical protein